MPVITNSSIDAQKAIVLWSFLDLLNLGNSVLCLMVAPRDGGEKWVDGEKGGVGQVPTLQIHRRNEFQCATAWLGAIVNNNVLCISK
jgi:hypothetical protein